MGRVVGLGGVFFKSQDPERLYDWYERHLGLRREEGGVFFRWRDRNTGEPGTTVWAVFENGSTYFEPTRAPFMLSYRVDLLLAKLRTAGAQVDERREDSQYGPLRLGERPRWQPHRVVGAAAGLVNRRWGMNKAPPGAVSRGCFYRNRSP
jgi:hypothetical protein